MDSHLHTHVRCARLIPYSVAMGLYIQHGSQCCRWSGAKHHVELFQREEISETQEALGSVAWNDRRLDSPSDELGTARLSPSQRVAGCTQSLALGNRWTHYLVV